MLAMAAGFSQCDIDYDFGDTEFGVSPDPIVGESFLDGMLDEPYYDVLHILIPATAAGIDSTYPPTLPVDSVIVLQDAIDGNGVYSGVVFRDVDTDEVFHGSDIGLEIVLNNNGDSPNENTFLGGMQYCAAIQGTPDRAGLYSMSIDIQAWATIFTPFNAPFTFENFSLRINCPLIDGVDVVNANSLDGTQGTLTVSLAEGVVATEIAWFNSSGLQIGTGESVTVANPGTFSVMVTTEDCQSEFGGWVVIDQGLDCTMTATVDVTNADEGEANGALALDVENAEGPWTATWYDGGGFILGTGETLEGLDAGDFSVLVVDSIGCSVEVQDIQVITGLEDIQGAWNAYPNPAHDVLVIQGLPLGSAWALVGLHGQVVAEGRGQQREVVRTGHFSNGMYVLRVANNQGLTFKQVLIQH
tara:strand:- start:5683 stop:6927 length:1245 start_codon:yes stop_codon:yes gene_type:complete